MFLILSVFSLIILIFIIYIAIGCYWFIHVYSCLFLYVSRLCKPVSGCRATQRNSTLWLCVAKRKWWDFCVFVRFHRFLRGAKPALLAGYFMELEANGKVRRLLAGICIWMPESCKVSVKMALWNAEVFIHLLPEWSILWEKVDAYLQKENNKSIVEERQEHG